MALGREDAVPEISTQRRLTKSCWLQGDEAGTAGKRRNFAPLLATTTTTPSTPHAPSPKPLCGRERCRVCRRRKVLLLLLLGRHLFVPCRVEESHRSGKSCVSIFISKKDAMSRRPHRRRLDLASNRDGPLSRVQKQRNIAATPSGAPVLEGGSETEIAWAKFPPNTWEH
jgi:hypothetical protein